MTVADLHPEDLLDLARDPSLDESDRRRLEEHVAKCPVCAFDLQVALDFEAEGAPMEGDEALLARIEGRVLAEMEQNPVGALAALAGGGDRAAAPGAHHPSGSGRASRNEGVRVLRWPLGVAATFALVAMLGGTAAAAWWVVEVLLAEPIAEQAAPEERSRAQRTPPERTAPEDTEAAPEVADDAVVADSVADASALPEDAGVRSSGRKRTHRVPSASELLERAAEHRRAGRLAAAEREYRLLQRRYPTSREHDVSRVSLGRLLLDRQGRARPALREFEAYLRKAPHGTLAEEARAGRALAFEHLRNGSKEAEAWRDLLREHPKSVYRAKATARLKALGR
ncbi:MAG: hypothetical protein KC416_04895 [Myxococcales bacterium]|nr:hypothetical protein [Myxococcales bacterium]